MSLYSTVIATAATSEVANAANNYDINDAANITNCAPINVAAPVSVASAATVNFSPSQRNSIETFQIEQGHHGWPGPCLDFGFQYALKYKKQHVKKIWGRILGLAWLKFARAALSYTTFKRF